MYFHCSEVTCCSMLKILFITGSQFLFYLCVQCVICIVQAVLNFFILKSQSQQDRPNIMWKKVVDTDWRSLHIKSGRCSALST